MLTLVATLISQMVRLIEASADLQASREGTVAALAEERRRLRRDLHDGLGPRLTGIAFTADAARNRLPSDPAAATELVVEVDAAELPEPLPAATEVAAYRIAVEALTNAARHSGCERAEVRLDLVGEDLVVEVVDDGRAREGRPQWRPGVGLVSMSERAAEVGGTLSAGPDRRPGGSGGRVRASLPLVATPPDRGCA